MPAGGKVISLEDIRPFVRNVVPGKWSWINHDFTIAYDCRVFSITDGEASLRLTDGSFRLKRGAAMFIGAGCPYFFSMIDGNPFSYICVNLDLTMDSSNIDKFIQPAFPDGFDPDKLVDKTLVPELSKPVVFSGESMLTEIVSELLDEFRSGLPYSGTRSSLLAADFIVQAVRMATLGKISRIRIVSDVKSFIHRNYAECITNRDIAAALGYHPYYVSRVFRAVTGTTPHQYLLDHRLSAARELLISGHASIDKVAASCGFATASHFTAAFKKKYGVSPSLFRGSGLI